MAKDISININSGTIIRTILFLLLLVFLYYFRDLVLIILTAIVIASSVEPLAKWFIKRKIPRVLAVILVYLGAAGIFVGIFVTFLPLIIEETSNLSEAIPQYVEAVNFWPSINDSGFLSGQTVQNITSGFSVNEILSGLKSTVNHTFNGFWQTVSSIFGGLLSFILIIVFSFYFAVQEYGIANFLKIVTPLKHEKYVIDLWKRSQLKIGRWMQGQLLLALFIGILVYLGLMILGVKYALLLAILAALAELIPLFGPILAAIPAILIGFMDGGTSLGFMVVGLYVIIQQFENHLIYPLVVKKVVGVPPLMVIIALLVGAKLAGFLGIIIAVPIAAVLMEFANDMEKQKRNPLSSGSGSK
ncbi:MAG: AI-2E family transporter [Patescibacteria group bacterium]|nr:AI-2E family transporter [Patescibacteria group bacterium]